MCMLKFIAPAHAEKSELQLSIYGSFLHSGMMPDALFMFSEIRKNDSFELRRALRNHQISTIVLSSPGGSVWEALNMAGIIHDKSLTTYVPTKGFSKNGECASACSFLFFAGNERVARGKLGVHQFYSARPDENKKISDTQEITQFTVSEIIGFLNEFGAPPFVYEKMFQQTEMYFFGEEEMLDIVSSNPTISAQYEKNIDSLIAQLQNYFLKNIDKKTKISEPKDDEVRVSAIKKMQEELNRLGCKAGVPDGIIGNKTRAALLRFNKVTANNFSIDKFPSKQLLNTLSSLRSIPACWVAPKLRPNYTAETCATINGNRACQTGKMQLEQISTGTYKYNTFCENLLCAYGTINVHGTKVTANVTDIDFTGKTHNYLIEGLASGNMNKITFKVPDSIVFEAAQIMGYDIDRKPTNCTVTWRY